MLFVNLDGRHTSVKTTYKTFAVYSTEINQVPDYIYDSVKSSNYRNFADEKASGKQILIAANEANPQYDAYEKGNLLGSIENKTIRSNFLLVKRYSFKRFKDSEFEINENI